MWLCWHSLQASAGFCGGRSGRGGVRIVSRQHTGGYKLLYFADVVIHPAENDGTSSVRSVSLNNFSHPSLEQSTKVFKSSFGLAKEQNWLEKVTIKGNVLISKVFSEMIALLKFHIFPVRTLGSYWACFILMTCGHPTVESWEDFRLRGKLKWLFSGMVRKRWRRSWSGIKLKNET